jgi:hypothetical protein
LSPIVSGSQRFGAFCFMMECRPRRSGALAVAGRRDFRSLDLVFPEHFSAGLKPQTFLDTLRHD